MPLVPVVPCGPADRASMSSQRVREGFCDKNSLAVIGSAFASPVLPTPWGFGVRDSHGDASDGSASVWSGGLSPTPTAADTPRNPQQQRSAVLPSSGTSPTLSEAAVNFGGGGGAVVGMLLTADARGDTAAEDAGSGRAVAAATAGGSDAPLPPHIVGYSPEKRTSAAPDGFDGDLSLCSLSDAMCGFSGGADAIAGTEHFQHRAAPAARRILVWGDDPASAKAPAAGRATLPSTHRSCFVSLEGADNAMTAFGDEDGPITLQELEELREMRGVIDVLVCGVREVSLLFRVDRGGSVVPRKAEVLIYVPLRKTAAWTARRPRVVGLRVDEDGAACSTQHHAAHQHNKVPLDDAALGALNEALAHEALQRDVPEFARVVRNLVQQHWA